MPWCRRPVVFVDSVGLVDQLGAFDRLQDNDLYHSGFVNRHGNLHHYSGVHHLDDHHGNLHDFGVVHQIVAVDHLGVVHLVLLNHDDLFHRGFLDRHENLTFTILALSTRLLTALVMLFTTTTTMTSTNMLDIFKHRHDYEQTHCFYLVIGACCKISK